MCCEQGKGRSHAGAGDGKNVFFEHWEMDKTQILLGFLCSKACLKTRDALEALIRTKIGTKTVWARTFGQRSKVKASGEGWYRKIFVCFIIGPVSRTPVIV